MATHHDENTDVDGTSHLRLRQLALGVDASDGHKGLFEQGDKHSSQQDGTMDSYPARMSKEPLDALALRHHRASSRPSSGSPLAPVNLNSQQQRTSLLDKHSLSSKAHVSQKLDYHGSVRGNSSLRLLQVTSGSPGRGSSTTPCNKPDEASKRAAVISGPAASDTARASQLDMAFPDLGDAELSPIDSHLLLSPFTVTEASFEDLASRPFASSPVSIPDHSPQSTHGRSPVLDEARADSGRPIEMVATPSSPPRQPFFTHGSGSSFARFPTPDKLSLGFTPSPVRQDQAPTSVLSEKSSSPLLSSSGCAPVLAPALATILRSGSSQTLQSESSFCSSMNDSSSSSGLSDILTYVPVPDSVIEEPAAGTSASISHVNKPMAQSKSERTSNLLRGHIRQSILSFPSPPTSPRTTIIGQNVNSLSAMTMQSQAGRSLGSLQSSSCSGRVTPALTQDSSSDSRVTMEETRPSLESLIANVGNASQARHRHDSVLPGPAPTKSVLEAGELHFSNDFRLPSLSLPPQMALPPLPTTSSLRSVPPRMTSTCGPEGLQRSISTPPVSVNRLATTKYSTPTPHTGSIIDISNAERRAPQPNVVAPKLRPSKSTESFLLSRKKRSPIEEAVPVLPVSKMLPQPMSPKTNRRRKASLSIKIPKVFSKMKRQDDFTPSGMLSPDALEVPQSRFSPDSDGPTPISEKAPTRFMKRLSRAVSSPNLKGTAQDQDKRSRKDIFVAPISAPPVPTTFVGAVKEPHDTVSPLPTPGLITDIDSSVNGDSPNPWNIGVSSSIGQLQHNPYFPSVPARQASQTSRPAPVFAQAKEDLRNEIVQRQPSPAAESRIDRPSQSSPLTGATLSATSRSDHSSQSGYSSKEQARGQERTNGDRSASRRPPFSSTPSGSSGEGNDDPEEDDYGSTSGSSDHYTDSCESSDDDESEDDDIPLAKAHPDALQIQTSLRAKAKEQSKKSRRRAGSDERKVEKGRSGSPAKNAASSDKRAAGVRMDKESQRKVSNNPPPPRKPFGFAPDELSTKLRGLEKRPDRVQSVKSGQSKRPDSSGQRPHDLLLPQTDEHVRNRSHSRGRSALVPPLVPFVQDSVLTMSEGSDVDDDNAPLRARTARRPRHEISRKTRESTPASPTTQSTPSSPLSPTARHLPFAALHITHQPSASANPHSRAGTSQQRVYINDPQHHCSFDVDGDTTPAMVLAHLREKGAISANPAYALHEVWRIMGVERPLREYENLQDSIASWGSEANSTILLVKKTHLAPFLSRSSKSSSHQGSLGGWVQQEVKRGKWSKRYIELRNQTLYVGKTEKLRDQTVLCHLSNFDAYSIPQACLQRMKTPRPFAFAVKSVDKVSLFENAEQDYVHYFAVKTEAERENWIKTILEERSGMLRQLVAAKAASHAADTRHNLVKQYMESSAQSTSQATPTAATHGHSVSPPATQSSSVALSRNASSKSSSPPMPGQATFSSHSNLQRRPSNAAAAQESKKIISADNLPPMPGAVNSPSFALLPQGRDWEKLGSEEKRLAIHEAGRRARTEGKTLLDFGDNSGSGVGLLGRSRAKSIGRRG